MLLQHKIIGSFPKITTSKFIQYVFIRHKKMRGSAEGELTSFPILNFFCQYNNDLMIIQIQLCSQLSIPII